MASIVRKRLPNRQMQLAEAAASAGHLDHAAAAAPQLICLSLDRHNLPYSFTAMPRSQRDRMLSGEFYDSRDPELLALAHRARALLATFAALPATEAAARHRTLVELLGHVGAGVWIEPPFFCDYGQHVAIGADSFINVNCVFLDAAPIQLGTQVLVGPGVQLLTVSHPVSAAERIVPPDGRQPGQAPYRTFARPIAVGDRAWIGASSIVLPGVTIGANAVIGAGSLVIADIPADCLAYGQPCRVQRSLSRTVATATDLAPPAV